MVLQSPAAGWIYSVLQNIGLLALLRGFLRRRASYCFGPTISHFPIGQRFFALTFDDGPSPGTLAVASVLARYGVRATFFLCGVNVLRYPEIPRHLLREGHELGNHTMHHARLCPRLGWQLNVCMPGSIFRDFARAQQAIEFATGYRPVLMRAPYGLRWFGMRATGQRLGLTHVGWSSIGRDWEWTAEEVADHVLQTVEPGAIVCLHDGRGTCADPDVSVTVAALEVVLPRLLAAGFQFATVSELIALSSAAGVSAPGRNAPECC